MGIFQPTPTGLITDDFPAGDGKEKVILQSWPTTSLGLFFFFKYITFSVYHLSNCT